jgi:site-specific recombinase XerD
MTPLRALFIDRLRVQKLSEKTIATYVSCVAGLANHCRTSPLGLSADQIRGYLLFLLEKRKYAASTFNLHLDAIKTFFRLMAPGSTVMSEFTHAKATRRIPSVLSHEEVDRLIAAAPKLKYKAIIMLLYSAGLRLMECVTIKPVHIESGRMKVRVEQGKGNRDRYTLLSRKTLDVLREYFRAARPRNFLFEGFGGNHISARMIGRIVSDAAHAAHIGKRVHPHTLRHSL